MKKKILKVLRESEKGLRVREIAARVPSVNPFAIIDVLDELLKTGLVRTVTVNNFVQGESYNLWQAV